MHHFFGPKLQFGYVCLSMSVCLSVCLCLSSPAFVVRWIYLPKGCHVRLIHFTRTWECNTIHDPETDHMDHAHKILFGTKASNHIDKFKPNHKPWLMMLCNITAIILRYNSINVFTSNIKFHYHQKYLNLTSISHFYQNICDQNIMQFIAQYISFEQLLCMIFSYK